MTVGPSILLSLASYRPSHHSQLTIHAKNLTVLFDPRINLLLFWMSKLGVVRTNYQVGFLHTKNGDRTRGDKKKKMQPDREDRCINIVVQMRQLTCFIQHECLSTAHELSLMHDVIIASFHGLLASNSNLPVQSCRN